MVIAETHRPGVRGDGNATWWRRRVLRTAATVNIACCLEPLGPALFAAFTASAVTLYALRRNEVAGAWPAVAVATPLLAAALWAWWRARPRFLARRHVLALLESRLGLESRLTAAEAGLVPWPEPVADPVTRWQPARLAAWSAGALALLLTGWLAPLSTPDRPARPGTAPPPALAEVQRLLDEAAALQVADPVALDHLERQAESLAERPPHEQYAQAGLEAADALRAQTLDGLNRLQQSLADAARALEAAARQPGEPATAERAEAALEALRELALGTNADLREMLESQDCQGGSSEALGEAASTLAEASQAVRGVLGAAGAEVEVAGEGQREGMETEVGQLGPGEPERGGGSAPLALQEQPGAGIDGTLQGLDGDAGRNALGDFVRETASAPPESTADAPSAASGGRAAQAGRGADAVWIDRLAPAEREAVRDIFQ
jgi:hypothetical protein